MPVAAILFDVGGPLDTEESHENAVDRLLPEAARHAGYEFTPGDYIAACAHAIEIYAPDLHESVVWQLCNGDRFAAHRAWALFTEAMSKYAFADPRPGMAALLGSLRATGLRLGAVPDQPGPLTGKLERLGMSGLFDCDLGTTALGARKPDTRLLLAVSGRLGVAPTDCVMVGDRVDADIVPARHLGMRTIRFRCGRHAMQDPRGWSELPDVEVATVDELAAAIDRLTAS